MKLMVFGRSWGRGSLFSAGIWLGSLLVAGGCRAEPPVPQVPSQPQGPSLHWSVPSAPAVTPRDPVLWVALAAHLRPPEPLRLSSAQGNLTLVTGTGRRISAPGLVLRWQMLPLAEPLQISRLVLGPFASFESAEAVAHSWRQQGAQAVVAHPGEWEVWAPLGSPAPAVGKPRPLQQLQRQRQVLVLASPLAAGGGAATANSVLEGPLQIDAPGGLRWQGGVYAGPFRLQGDAYGSWSLVEQVPLERYLLGVVPHEIGAGAPASALEAQAVLARTWALRNQGRFAVDGYHLCSDTQCQVYGDPRGAGAAVKRAVVATQSRVLSWAGQPIHAVYHASNGGVSAGFEEAWGGAGLPYLKPAIVQLAVAVQGSTGSTMLWKPLNHQLLMRTRHDSPMVRFAALQITKALVERLGEEYLMLVPETLPFVVEALADMDEEVEAAAPSLAAVLETLLGESLNEYLTQ